MIRVSLVRNEGVETYDEVCNSFQSEFQAKNKAGDMAAMSVAEFESEVFTMLKEAEEETEILDARYSSIDALVAMRMAIVEGVAHKA